MKLLNTLAVTAIFLCLITTGCKKDVTPTSTTTTKGHHTIVLRNEAGANARPLVSFNAEMGLGYLNGNDYSIYPAPALNAIAWTIGGDPVIERTLLRFSSLPCCGGNTPPTAAYLTLYSDPAPQNGDLVNANTGSNNAFYIRRVTNSWVPTATTWFNQPATTTSGQVLIPHTDSPFLDLVNIDVTQMVRDMYTTGNYGFMMQLQTEDYYNGRIFCASNNANFNKRPTLTIVF